MTFLTIFTAPKPFEDPHIVTIQRNAIKSWTLLGSDVDVILMGRDVGVAEAAAELGARHQKDVPLSEQGLPLISGMFERARQESGSPYLAYVNADIILLPDFVQAVRRVAELEQKFLLVGQRWNMDVTEPLDFSAGWEERLRDLVAQSGSLFTLKASDFFVFPRQLFTDLPDLMVGRSGWDNWMMYHGTTQPWPAVDITHDVVCIHQNHDYAHLPGGQNHHKLEESMENVRRAGGWRTMYEMIDVNKRLKNGQLRPQKYWLLRWLHQIELRLEPPDRRGRRWALTLWLRRFRTWLM